MITVSLCMIVKNEEKVLGRCLESVKELVDEIIIVDTGSSDRTREIGTEYTDKIYEYSWQEDFSAARNFSFEKGSSDFLMWLDADDVITAKSAERFLELKEHLNGETDVVMMPYVTGFDENGKPAFLYYRERLVKNNGRFHFRGRVHEAIPVYGRILHADIPIEHRKEGPYDSRRNLRIYEAMENAGEMFDSRALYYYGRELMFHENYEKGIDVLEKFLECPDGWVENKIDGARQLAVCCYRVQDEEKALRTLFRTLEYDVPRGETCCDLGRHFQERGRYEQAVYWYKQALRAKKGLSQGAFVTEECYGFLPAISLCVCYDRMGKRKKAEKYNELAGQFCPDSPFYLYNKALFEGQTDKQKTDFDI